MAVTLEQIKEAAKKLKIKLTEEQEKAYLALDKLPEEKKKETSSGDDKNRIPLERFNEINTRMKAAEKESEDFKKKLEDIDTDKAKKKGDYEKLGTDLKKKIEENDNKVKSIAESFKTQVEISAKKSAIETELIKEGCIDKYVAKAIKLFDESKVSFSFTDEENFKGEVQEFKDYMKEFKEDNPFLFDGENKDTGSGDSETSLFKPKTVPKKEDNTDKKEAEKEVNLEGTFPALKNVTQF